MLTRRQWQNLGAALLLAGLPFTSPTASADEPVEAPAIPPYPGTLGNTCGSADCLDTLHASHELTFISRLAFPLGTARLTRDAQNELLRLLVELESFAVVEHVEIVGHADPSGPENYNRWMSEVRARRVRDYFLQNGVDPRKVTLRGAGASEPLSGAIDPSEHRRIEVHVTVRPWY